jgi:transposase
VLFSIHRAGAGILFAHVFDYDQLRGNVLITPDKQIHLIIDNYSAHKHANVRQWLTGHPRFHIHYTPTSGSWLSQVERVFGEVTCKCLKHRSAATVEALHQDIDSVSSSAE